MVYCIFSAQYLPTAGGVERYTYNISKKLISRGNDVVIVTTLLDGQNETETDENGAKIIRVPSMLFMDGRLPMMRPFGQKKLFEKLDTFKIDRIIVQTRLYTLCIAGMKYATKRNINSIAIEHGSGYVSAANALVRFGEKMYEDVLIGKAKKLCKSFYSVSQASGKWLSSIGIQSKGVLYNSVDDDNIQKLCAEKQRDFKAEFNIPKDKETVAFVGRMIPEKGIIQLDAAMKKLYDKYGVHFIAAGDGPLLKRLQADASQGIHYVGSLNYKDVIALLRSSDIMCLPSDNEGFPTSVVEAVVCGCYVVTSPYGGAKELISDDSFGMVLADNSEASIISGISKALDDKAQRESAVLCAKKRFEESFTWDATTDALIAAFG